MVNLFDIMRQAQSGIGFQNLSRQYGLSVEQTQRAVEALLPAFTLAFQHALRDPAAFAPLLEMMSSGTYLRYFDPSVSGSRSQGSDGGEAVIKTLFGSDEVSRRVASQASAMTGIATGVLHRMLPTIAAVLMGGLFRYASAEGVSEALRGWADWLQSVRTGEAETARRDPTALERFYSAWSDLVSVTVGRPEPKPPAPQPAPLDPWSTLINAMFGVAPVPPPPPPPPPSQPNPFEVLNRMFETGREVQAQHLASLRTIFDAFWGSARRPG